MKRRRILAVAAAASVGLSGCLASKNDTDDGSSGGDDSPSDGTDTDGKNGDDTGDDESSGENESDPGGHSRSNCDSPEITDRGIATTGTTCGSQDTDDASMSVEGESIVVEGTLSASTPCHDAVLAGASVEEGELQVRVDVSQLDRMCQQCIGEITYRATVAVEDVACLQSVAVSHVDGGEYSFDVES